MVTVKRSFLQRNYKPQPQAESQVDARLFNRKEEHEVVAMIQRVADHLNARHHHIHYIEDLIAGHLPGNVRGQTNVFDWLVKRLDR